MGWGNMTNYFSLKWSNYTLLQRIILTFILMVQPYEVEAMTNCREGKKGQYGSLRHQGTELSLHSGDGMLFILLW